MLRFCFAYFAQVPRALRAGALALTFAGLAPMAQALTITGYQDGADYRFDYTGTLNVTGMLDLGSVLSGASPNIEPSSGEFYAGSGTFDGYLGVTSTPVFGSGSTTFGGIQTGDMLAFGGSLLLVEFGFVSGSTLTGSLVFANSDATTLGLTAGSYSVVLPNDTIALDIGAGSPAPVPLPAGAVLLMTALGGLGIAARRRRR